MTITYRPLKPREVPVEQALVARQITTGDFEGALPAFTVPERIAWQQRIGAYVARAIPYLWVEEMRRTASAMPLPKHIISMDLLPHQAMWWSWEVDVDIRASDSGQKTGQVGVGLVIVGHPKEFEVLSINRTDTNPGGPVTNLTLHLTSLGRVRYGSRYPEDVINPGARQVLALLAFLNSPYIEAVPVSTRPHNKGQLRRTHQATPVVRVIQLRAAVRESSDQGMTGNHIEWRTRWMVRGHYRAQWYPSTQSHRVIWVAPYIKGPEEAPFKAPLYMVAR